jgi:uncharacterized repeat protein (TIGR03803 family)
MGDATGALYGTTAYGPGRTNGTIFELIPSGGGYAERELYKFPKNEQGGGFPWATLTPGAQGVLYGTTSEGGSYMGGTVFSLTPRAGGRTYTENVVHSFIGGRYGNNPDDRLISDASGALYGTTKLGGEGGGCASYGCGTVFRLTP